MEIISIEKRVFDSLITNLTALVNEAEMLSNKEDCYLKEWLDNQDVCNILNVSKRTLQTYRDNGRLPYTQIDRKIYYKPSDVEFLLNNIKQKKYTYE